eukprot:scpid89573/ scgid24937/ 
MAECGALYGAIGVETALLLAAIIVIALLARQVTLLKRALSATSDPEKDGGGRGAGATAAVYSDQVTEIGDGETSQQASLSVNTTAAASASVDLDEEVNKSGNQNERKLPSTRPAPAIVPQPPQRARSHSVDNVIERNTSESASAPAGKRPANVRMVKSSGRRQSSHSDLMVQGTPPALPPDQHNQATPDLQQSYQNMALNSTRPVSCELAPSRNMSSGTSSGKQPAASHNTVTITSSIRSDDFSSRPVPARALPSNSISSSSSTAANPQEMQRSASVGQAAAPINYTMVELKAAPTAQKQQQRPSMLAAPPSQLPTLYTDVVLKTK